jgi:BTB/POZ domain/BTB And C-terminal Kelch
MASTGDVCILSHSGGVIWGKNGALDSIAFHRNNMPTDVTLLVGEKRIEVKAHRWVLASKSEYFRGLLMGSFPQAIENQVEILHCGAGESFVSLIEFCYTNYIEANKFSNANTIELLQLSNYLQMNEFTDAIESELMDSVNIGNCFMFHDIATRCNLKLLDLKCYSFISRNASFILGLPSTLRLDIKFLLSWLKRRDFCVNELDVIKFLIKWRRNNPKTKVAAQKLVSAVNFDAVPLEFICRKASGLRRTFTADKVLNIVLRKIQQMPIGHFPGPRRISLDGRYTLKKHDWALISDQGVTCTLPIAWKYFAQQERTEVLTVRFKKPRNIVLCKIECNAPEALFCSGKCLLQFEVMKAERAEWVNQSVCVHQSAVQHIGMQNANGITQMRISAAIPSRFVGDTNLNYVIIFLGFNDQNYDLNVRSASF